MRTITIALLLSGITIAASAQNLLPNPNFTNYNHCPTTYSNILDCTSWSSPNHGTPEYFNSCTSGALSVPLNLTGYQAAADGAYTGAYSYAQGGGAAEFITATLPALQVGKTYKVTLKVSLCDSATHGCDGLGVLFRMNAWADSTGLLVTATPQIDYSSYGAITDKVNWQILSKTFVADSAYTHILIGNFKTEASLTKVLDPSVVTMNTPFAYYYYDSASVERVTGADVAEEEKPFGARVYPNPFTDHCTIRIENSGNQPCNLSVFNVQGALVRSIPGITGQQATFYRGELPVGFYFYELRTNDGMIANGKLIIR